MATKCIDCGHYPVDQHPGTIWSKLASSQPEEDEVNLYRDMDYHCPGCGREWTMSYEWHQEDGDDE